MSIDKTGYWFFIVCRFYLIIIVSENVYSQPSRPCKLSNRRRQPSRSVFDTPSIKMSYKLDSWSQYDNPEEGKAREGDILDNSVARKTTTTDRQLLWPNGLVRYFVEQTIVDEPSKLAILEDAMKNIMELTCVKFVRIYPDGNGELPDHSWVNITGYEEGCYSDLGRSTFGPSNLNLDVRKCFRTRGHALHEILHTLGVYHEHMRPDRDDYIEIIWKNMKKGDTLNFRIMEDHAVTNYGLPYDYDSIMHYSMTAFSKNRSLPTIVPRKEGVTIGQRNHLSFYDVQKLSITYECDNVDREYAYGEINRDHRTDVESSSSNAMITSDDFYESNINDLGSITRRLREYRVPRYRKSMYNRNVPIMWKPFYEIYHTEYGSYPRDFYYYYYYYR